ncbi:MAG: dihydropteroate synthase [Verrucomicrobia bacterium]|nr:dihydropteroate synthase [Verrucomicrobiota bacterium]
MSIPNLTLIGERINPGFASSKALLNSENLPGLQALAVDQVTKGAHFLTINVGDKATSNPAFLVKLIEALQAVVDVPLAFDYPSRPVQEICLRTYDPAKACGRKPIVNSISELRWDMIELRKLCPFRLVVMASERLENGKELSNRTAEEIALTAHRSVERILNDGGGFAPDDLIVDVSLFPMASDTEGLTKRTLEAIRLIGSDPDLRGVHLLVGLSNLGIMLPRQARDGSRLSTKLESAFLTLSMPHGLDTILGTPGRDYQLLPDDDFVLSGFKEAIGLDGFDTLLKLRELYQMD